MRGNLQHIFKIKMLSIIVMLFFITSVFALPLSNALKLKISNASYSDETVIRYLAEATSGFDGSYDALKLFSSNPAVPSIYTKIGTSSCLSINTYPDLLKDEQVPLYTVVGSAGTYTITAIEIGAFVKGIDIFIENIETGFFQNLRTNPVYTFNVPDTEMFNTKTAKFKIYFSLPVVFFVPNTATTNNVCIISKKGIDKWIYEVKDNFNNVVASANFQTDVDTLSGLPEGIYLFTSYFGNITAQTQTFTLGEITRVNQFLKEDFKFFLDGSNLVVDFNNIIQENIVVTILTIEGREVAKAQISYSSKFTIPLNENASSIYIVKLQANDTTVIKKVPVGLLHKR